MPKSKTQNSVEASAPGGRDHLRLFTDRLPQLVQSIRELVEIESPSDHKPSGDRMGAILAEKFHALGGRVRIHPAKDYADHVQVDFPGHEKAKPILLLGHFDTVYPLGTLATMPCRIADGKMHGPGVFDMKSGVALMLAAIEALQTGTVPCLGP